MADTIDNPEFQAMIRKMAREGFRSGVNAAVDAIRRNAMNQKILKMSVAEALETSAWMLEESVAEPVADKPEACNNNPTG